MIVFENTSNTPNTIMSVKHVKNTIKGGYIMTDKSENRIQSEIMVELSKRGHKVWRSNAGKIQDGRTGNWIKLFPPGYPDLTGFRKCDGKFIVIEVKDHKGKLSKQQKLFSDFARTQPILYGVARSVEDAINIIEG